MPETKITPFSSLSPEQLAKFQSQANWMQKSADGQQTGSWTEVRDDFYRVVIQHILVEQNGKSFDKYNIQGWGVFVLPMQISAERSTGNPIANFCIPTEFRPLIKDASGENGHVWMPNIPQGGIKPGESFLQAALREAEEEIGVGKKNATDQMGVLDILKLGKTYTEPSNSEGYQETFLALVSDGQAGQQKLEETEQIDIKWYNWRQLLDGRLEDSRTKATLFDVLATVDQRLLDPSTYGRFALTTSRLELSPEESLAWYIQDHKYPTLKALTNIPTYHPFDATMLKLDNNL